MLIHKPLFGTYTKVSRYPHFRGGVVSIGFPLYIKVYFTSMDWISTELSSFQGVRIKEFHCIHRCPHFRGLE